MTNMLEFSPCCAHINLDCIRHNYTFLSALLPERAQGMPILKSDAYGHGLLSVARALKDAPCFGVGTVSEAHALRQAHMTQDILVLLGALNEHEMGVSIHENLLPLVNHMDALHMAAQCATRRGRTVRIALKCDTGMARLGFTHEEIPRVRDFLRQNPCVDVALALTHFASADNPASEASIHAQAKQFMETIGGLQEDFPRMRLSLGNSAGSIAHGHMPHISQEGFIFRFGVALYGGNPFHKTAWAHKGEGLQEAMRISAPVLQVRTLQAGQSIGYGSTFVAPQSMRVAVAGIGYADGFSRSLSNPSSLTSGGHVLINGALAPICGRVCMGMIMVDISHIDDVRVGQRAWITHGTGASSMQHMADAWGTIIHEAMCLLGKNARHYVENPL